MWPDQTGDLRTSVIKNTNSFLSSMLQLPIHFHGIIWFIDFENLRKYDYVYITFLFPLEIV